MKINNIEIKAKKFAFDGCHKIYILDSERQTKAAIKCGLDIKNIEGIIDTYNTSCQLRFVRFWDLRKNGIVPQGY